MSTTPELSRAYHVERAAAIQLGITAYRCACLKCHGFKTQRIGVVETHHRKYGRDRTLTHPLLYDGNENDNEESSATSSDRDEEMHSEDEFFESEDNCTFEDTIPNTNARLEDMAQDFFGRADDIHQQFANEADGVLDFDDLSSDEEEPDRPELLEELLYEASEPLFEGSRTSRLRFSIILMSLCTLFGVSPNCLDEILTFLKDDVLPNSNCCPKNSCELKCLLMKLGLSHQIIHCCECGRTLYWRENSTLTSCPHCLKLRFVERSNAVPIRVLRFFSLIKRLKRMFQCPQLAKHMRWHSTNHSHDGKMRSVVDFEQWQFINEAFPSFSSEARNVRMGLALDGVNPHSMQSSRHFVMPRMIVLYNLPRIL